MVCCVLTAALLAWLGRVVRRLSGRDGPPVAHRPPPPVRRVVRSDDGPGGRVEVPALVDA